MQALRRVPRTGPHATHAASYCMDRSSEISEMAIIKRLHTYHIIIIWDTPPPRFCAATRLITCTCMCIHICYSQYHNIPARYHWLKFDLTIIQGFFLVSLLIPPSLIKCLEKEVCDSIQICAFPQLTPCLTSKIVILFISFLDDT